MTTYRGAGVDIRTAEGLLASLEAQITATWGESVLGPFGSFAAGVKLPSGLRDPVLMMTTDGIGTKADLARRLGKLGGLGFDLVAMCIDDLAAVGARAIGFCDYLAVGRIDDDRDRVLIGSVAEACAAAGCPLLGGETAEHPGVLGIDQFDLVGAALGVVADGDQITGESIRPGDMILGLASPNLRSNGFSLVRSLVAGLDLTQPLGGMTEAASETLLEPSILYAPAVLEAVSQTEVHGLAHVTGGGLVRNLGRVLPSGCQAVIETSSWQVPPVFEAIRALGSVSPDEMARTFNLGIGFCLIAPEEAIPSLIEPLQSHQPVVIGRIRPGDASVHLSGSDMAQ